jgi:hypothetical protein
MKYGVWLVMILLLGCSFNEGEQLKELTLEATNTKLILYDCNTLVIETEFRYQGEDLLYFAYGNQLVREGDELYYGFNDFDAQLQLLKRDRNTQSFVQIVSYELVKFSSQGDGQFIARMHFDIPQTEVFIDASFEYDRLEEITALNFILYLYRKDLLVEDEIYTFDRGRKEYIELLESGEGEQFILRATNFVLVDKREGGVPCDFFEDASDAYFRMG